MFLSEILSAQLPWYSYGAVSVKTVDFLARLAAKDCSLNSYLHYKCGKIMTFCSVPYVKMVRFPIKKFTRNRPVNNFGHEII